MAFYSLMSCSQPKSLTAGKASFSMRPQNDPLTDHAEAHNAAAVSQTARHPTNVYILYRTGMDLLGGHFVLTSLVKPSGS